MDINELAQQIEAMVQRTNALQQDLECQRLHPDATVIAELSTALEELRVAEEELRLQNEELHLTQVALTAERQRYQELFELAPGGYLVTDSDGLIQQANRAAADLLGVDQFNLQRKPLANFVVFEARSAFRQLLLNLPDDMQEWEIRLRPRKGMVLDTIVTVTALRDSDGKPLQLRWLLRDVTQHKRAEQQVYALNNELIQRALFEATLRKIQDKVRATLDEQQILQTAVQELTQALNLVACDTAIYDLQNQTSTIHCGYSSQGSFQLPPIGSKIAMANFPEGYQQLLQGQEFQFCELTRDSFRSQLAILACPIADHQEILGDLWCFSPKEFALDENQVQLVQQVANQCAIALRQARLYQSAQAQVHELAILNCLKDNFLSTVSHELRTPLTNMKMALHLLQISNKEDQRIRCMQILQTECDREINLITDLLDLQQLETAVYPAFLPESIVLQQWLPTIIAPFNQKMHDRQQPFVVDLSDQLPPILTDQASLRRLLVELLLNAHKYTPNQGEIILRVDHDPSSDKIVLTIRNQAEIPTDELPRIFEKFYRIPSTNAWGVSGTGLGLALVKQLLIPLQGTIQASSNEGWTTFTLELPTLIQLNGLPPKS